MGEKNPAHFGAEYLACINFRFFWIGRAAVWGKRVNFGGGGLFKKKKKKTDDARGTTRDK